MTKKHASLSASGTNEWSKCAGSVVLTELLPVSQQNDGNDFARLGTCAHALLEQCLTDGTEAALYLDRIICIKDEGTPKERTEILKKHAKLTSVPNGAYKTIVDQDMEEAVQEALDYVGQRLQVLFGNPCTKTAATEGYMRLEQRLTILVDRDDSFGTGDIILDAWPEMLEIVDYKNGSGVGVEVVDGNGDANLQLQSYALGSAEAAGWDYHVYRFTVAQPRKAHADGRIRSHEVTEAELLDFKQYLTNAAIRVDMAREIAHEIGSDTPDGSSAVEIADSLFRQGLLVAGSQCTWCKAKYNREFDQPCPAIVAQSEEAAQMAFDDNPEDFDVAEKIPDDLPELAKMLTWAPVLENLLKALKAHATTQIFAGHELPGFKIVRGRSPGRKFVTMRQETDAETGQPVFEEDGLTPLMVPITDEWLKNQLVSVYQADPAKLYKPADLRTAPQIEKEIPKQLRKGFNESLLWSPPGSLTMVSADDPRPAEAPNDASADFEGLDDEGGEE